MERGHECKAGSWAGLEIQGRRRGQRQRGSRCAEHVWPKRERLFRAGNFNAELNLEEKSGIRSGGVKAEAPAVGAHPFFGISASRGKSNGERVAPIAEFTDVRGWGFGNRDVVPGGGGVPIGVAGSLTSPGFTEVV